MGNDKNVTRSAGARWRTVLEDARRLGSPSERKRTGLFIMEGIRLHERAIRAGARIDVVLMSESAARDDTGRWREIRSELQRLDVETVIAPDDVLAELTGGRKNGPVVGIVSRPEPVSMAGLMANTAANSTTSATKCLPLFLVADNVEDPGNVGAMIRTALAAGATGFAAIGISDPFHPRAVWTSMGSLFRIPVQCFASAKEAIDYFHAAGLEAVGAVSTAGVPLTELHSRPKQKGRAIFLGSEAFGLCEGTLERLDWMVTIPMASEVDSYSVNAAAAILMHKFAGEER